MAWLLPFSNSPFFFLIWGLCKWPATGDAGGTECDRENLLTILYGREILKVMKKWDIPLIRVKHVHVLRMTEESTWSEMLARPEYYFAWGSAPVYQRQWWITLVFTKPRHFMSNHCLETICHECRSVWSCSLSKWNARMWEELHIMRERLQKKCQRAVGNSKNLS